LGGVPRLRRSGFLGGLGSQPLRAGLDCAALAGWFVWGVVLGGGASRWMRVRFRRGGLGAGAWIRFFVAEGAPQNDGGFLVGWELWRRFALDALVAWAAWEKRRQSRRTPKVLGGAMVGGANPLAFATAAKDGARKSGCILGPKPCGKL
jgi:hypothetical protein